MTSRQLALPRQLRGRWPADDRGSMAILMMVMLVGLMLGALLVPMVVTQSRTTRFDATRVQALDAAQSGIDVAQGLIRAGVTSGIGDASKLPCGPLSGSVGGSGAAAYAVVVEYFTFDPGQAKNPRSTPPEVEPYPSSNAMSCAAGMATPSYARFTSTGTVGTATNGSTAGRTLTSTYVFRTSNLNLIGGQLALSANGSATTLCIDTGPPTAPTTMLQPCTVGKPTAASQVFAYRSDLTLQLLSSVPGSVKGQGSCLDTEHSPALSTDVVVLGPCGPLGQPVPTQQWSYTDGKLQAAQADSSTTGNLTNFCMTVTLPVREKQVRLGDCSSAAAWAPSPPIGPGAATSSQRGANAAQWVNYNEFSRCLDVTAQNPDSAFLIDYPCTQNPYPGAVRWNQSFQSPVMSAGQISATGQLSTTAPSGQYCLTTPGTNGGYVTVRPCTGSAFQTWTIYGGDQSLNYSMKYTVVSGSLCLGLSATGREGAPWSVIDVETCNGSTQQKWNAVANVLNSTSTNLHEK